MQIDWTQSTGKFSCASLHGNRILTLLLSIPMREESPVDCLWQLQNCSNDLGVLLLLLPTISVTASARSVSGYHMLRYCIDPAVVSLYIFSAFILCFKGR